MELNLNERSTANRERSNAGVYTRENPHFTRPQTRLATTDNN
ncbi:hypothetical protein [Paraburkholderia unamae]|uniref:Uncharacterized protein n=1 Tax=Paraburkholderia unamae TaxID=219649 RepID=A0ACC6RF69_9BURK